MVTGGTLVVELADAGAHGFVLADAVQIQPIASPPSSGGEGEADDAFSVPGRQDYWPPGRSDEDWDQLLSLPASDVGGNRV